MKVFRHYAEVCPHCGAVGSMRANIPDPKHRGRWLFQGSSLTVGTERRTYVACTKCLTRALRVTSLPPEN